MKIMNLYLKVIWDEDFSGSEIVDVRRDGRKVSKKYWDRIYKFFLHEPYLWYVNGWSTRTRLIYENRVYDVELSYEENDDRDVEIYRMRIYK